jgi:hypothetical protein
MEEEQYGQLIVRVGEALTQWPRQSLTEHMTQMDARAIEHEEMPDVRPLLAEMERAKPPAKYASWHPLALFVLRDLRDLRAERSHLADAYRALKRFLDLLQNCDAAITALVAKNEE